MPLFNPQSRRLAEAIDAIAYCNPFSPDRLEAEKSALGEKFKPAGAAWSKSPFDDESRPNVAATRNLAESLLGSLRPQLEQGVKPGDSEARLYESVVIYALYYRLHAGLRAYRVHSSGAAPDELYRQLVRDLQELVLRHELPGLEPIDPAHLLACFDQIVRAFDQIYLTINGASQPAARLRAAVWESIFTHDMRRYRRFLFNRTGDFATLIVGPSGTGKELVARAIATSRYIPFDPKRKEFAQPTDGAFAAVNLSALSPTLVESELFGHRRGAFTGATEDRKGWFEMCPPLGSVFLDEIGELDGAIQVKLLRVLQSRTFQRIGQTQALEFRGKIIAATNRDLGQAMQHGTFRSDFYYRLCSDVITTPSLREQLDDSPEELRRLVTYVAMRLLPEDAPTLVTEALKCIRGTVGEAYAWPGNFRELEQCVRNVLIRGTYRPLRYNPDAKSDWLGSVTAGTLSADELLNHYSAQVYRQQGTYERAASVLKLDRRTVRARAQT